MNYKDIRNSIENIFEDMRIWRRQIHMHPELSFKEFETSAFIQNILKELNIKYDVIAETGVVAYIGSGNNCVALRADIDALPINEETNLPYSSKNEGIMHACGHDMHTAMLLGAAKYLKSTEMSLDRTIKLIFQPGEEQLPGGAELMIKHGVLKDPIPKAVFGQHVSPEHNVGTVAFKSGPVMASTDELYIRIDGKSGHAAQPHLAGDAIITASQIVVNAQLLLSKFKNPLHQGVISFTAINGGNVPNIFPDTVNMMGTMRSFQPEWREKAKELLRKMVRDTAEFNNCKAELTIVSGYQALINDEKLTTALTDTAEKFFGKENVLEFEPKMWAEDFAYYAAEVPSVFWFTGIKKASEATMPPLHNSKLAPEEEALIYGATMLVAAALMKI